MDGDCGKIIGPINDGFYNWHPMDKPNNKDIYAYGVLADVNWDKIVKRMKNERWTCDKQKQVRGIATVEWVELLSGSDVMTLNSVRKIADLIQTWAKEDAKNQKKTTTWLKKAEQESQKLFTPNVTEDKQSLVQILRAWICRI